MFNLEVEFISIHIHVRASLWVQVLEDVVFVAVFHQIVGFSMKSSYIKNVLHGNATSELEKPQRQQRKQENKKETGSISKTKTVRAAQFLADFIAIIPQPLLCKLDQNGSAILC